MIKSLRNPLIGLLCLSTVGCANITGDDVATAGVVVGLGALAVLLLLSSDADDDKDRKEHGDRGGHKEGGKHGYGKDHGKGHPGRR